MIQGLGVVRVNGIEKLVVSPWAALGTDTLLLGASTALFLSTRSPGLKIAAGVGGIWGLTAAVVEIFKLSGVIRP